MNTAQETALGIAVHCRATRMTGFGSRTLGIVGAMILSVGLPAHAGAFDMYYGSEYTLLIPPGWVRVPPTTVRHAQQELESSAVSTEQFDAIFQEKFDGDWVIEYPYIAVVVKPYPSGRQPTKGEMESGVRELTGLDVAKALDGSMKPSYRNLLSVSSSQASLDSATNSFQWTFEITVAKVGKVRCDAVGHFGKDATVVILCYDMASQWQAHAADCQAIAQSFRFIPGYEWRSEFDRPAGKSFFSGTLQAAMIGFLLPTILGLTAVLGAYIKKIRTRNKPAKVNRNDPVQPDGETCRNGNSAQSNVSSDIVFDPFERWRESQESIGPRVYVPPTDTDAGADAHSAPQEQPEPLVPAYPPIWSQAHTLPATRKEDSHA